MDRIEVEVIELTWEGPLLFPDDVKDKLCNRHDHGIYQIYGTHNILGPETLLYIGKAQKDTFAERVPKHEEWTVWEPNKVHVYVGRLGSIHEMSQEDWESNIDRAERLLIYFCAPPCNSHGLQSYGVIPDTIILNFNHRHRLPLGVSTFYEKRQIARENSGPKRKEYEKE